MLALRRRVVVLEVVDELLDANGIHGRQLAFLQDAPHVGVGRGVHID
jgi:hypothetical protein